MIKFGIYTIAGLKAELQRSQSRRTKQVSILLLRNLDGEPEADLLRERVLLELSDDRGAYKRTYKNRFNAFDDIVTDAITEHHATNMPLDVLDCGISDGRTAVEFFKKLVSRFPNLSYLGTDYDPYLRSVSVGAATLVFSSKNEPVQLVRPPFVFNLKVLDRWITYPINRLVLSRLRRSCLPQLESLLAANEKVELISLFCDDATCLSEGDNGFQLAQLNVMHPLPGSYHLIRMMNLLNPTYFSNAEFETIINNVRNGLNERGLLVVGSNQNAGSAVKGGIYQFVRGGFIELTETGMYPQLREIILRSDRSAAGHQ